jgi:hypothetical protein
MDRYSIWAIACPQSLEQQQENAMGGQRRSQKEGTQTRNRRRQPFARTRFNFTRFQADQPEGRDLKSPISIKKILLPFSSPSSIPIIAFAFAVGVHDVGEFERPPPSPLQQIKPDRQANCDS